MIASDGALTADTRGIIAGPLLRIIADQRPTTRNQLPKAHLCKSQHIGASQGWPSYILL
jgi:hypothetical protein